MKKELSSTIKNMQIMTNCCDILIRSGLVLVTTVKYSGNFFFYHDNEKIVIEEQNNNNNPKCVIENDNVVIQSLKRVNTIVSENNVVSVDGKIVKGTYQPISDIDENNSLLEVYVPKNLNLGYQLKSTGGDISVYGIYSSDFAAKTICGYIELMNMNSESIYVSSNFSDMYLNSVQSNNINIHSVSGSTDIQVDDDRRNYILENHTISGNVDVNSYYNYDNSNYNANKKIYVETFSGDIDIMFRGKR